MRLRVLGPVEVVGDDSRPVALAPMARQLLAVLALHSPRAVPVDDLASLLWDEPPPTAVKSLQAHVSRLRAACGSAATIELTGVGYVLRVAEGQRDVDVVAAHRAAARRWLEHGRPDDAAAELAAARALWRGSVELPDTVAARALATQWRRQHHQLVDEHLAAAVQGSHPEDVVPELESATASDPFDERRWALLVRALHRIGDVAGALRAYQLARSTLVDIGLEPGAELRAAELAVLSNPATPMEAELDDLVVRYADTGAGRVAYTVVGAGTVDTVLLNPGLLSIGGITDGPALRTAIDRLAGDGAVACLDRRGIGLSDPVLDAGPTASPTIDDWAIDVATVIEAVSQWPVVVACSDACLAALAVAAARPDLVRGLVLVHGYARYTRDGSYPYGVDRDTAAWTSADVLDVDNAHPQFDPLAHIAPSVAHDEAFRRWFDHVGRRAASPSTATALHTAILHADVRPLLPHVRAPVLLLHRRSCASSDVGHARYLRDHLPSAELVLLPGADELWFVGGIEALVDAVERWTVDQ